ncbi:hypothetical protein B0H14DRAFT_2560939 [Mycena olivaceomarginata]|nr:hypothetical protein B0H14DRAFT_2560939 [Mycena olivaceomarginata]
MVEADVRYSREGGTRQRSEKSQNVRDMRRWNIKACIMLRGSWDVGEPVHEPARSESGFAACFTGINMRADFSESRQGFQQCRRRVDRLTSLLCLKCGSATPRVWGPAASNGQGHNDLFMYEGTNDSREGLGARAFNACDLGVQGGVGVAFGLAGVDIADTL